MAKQFKLQVLTPEKALVDEMVESIVVPGQDGYVGVLADHAPLMLALGSGTLTVKRDSLNVTSMHVEGGFLEVLDNVATILADRIAASA